jgi:hypothetical protein
MWTLTWTEFKLKKKKMMKKKKKKMTKMMMKKKIHSVHKRLILKLMLLLLLPQTEIMQMVPVKKMARKNTKSIKNQVGWIVLNMNGV